MPLRSCAGLLRGAAQRPVDAQERSPLDREQALLHRVQPPLQADDVHFAQSRHVDRVGSLVHNRRPWEGDPLPLAQRAQRIAKTDVDHERPLPKATLERVLIDDE
jgi:hypothetical protein